MSGYSFLAKQPLSYVHSAAITAALEESDGAIYAARCRCTARYLVFKAGGAQTPQGFVRVMERIELEHAIVAAGSVEEAQQNIDAICRRNAEHLLP